VPAQGPREEEFLHDSAALSVLHFVDDGGGEGGGVAHFGGFRDRVVFQMTQKLPKCVGFFTRCVVAVAWGRVNAAYKNNFR
jgi:hypothetical protein